MSQIVWRNREAGRRRSPRREIIGFVDYFESKWGSVNYFERGLPQANGNSIPDFGSLEERA